MICAAPHPFDDTVACTKHADHRGVHTAGSTAWDTCTCLICTSATYTPATAMRWTPHTNPEEASMTYQAPCHCCGTPIMFGSLDEHRGRCKPCFTHCGETEHVALASVEPPVHLGGNFGGDGGDE